MAEISHQKLSKHLSDYIKTTFPPVYLVFGESYLRAKACQALIDALIPDAGEQATCIESSEFIDRMQVTDLLERLNTYSFFSSKQVVVLRNAMVFSGTGSFQEPIKKIKKAYDNNDAEKAADLFLRLLGQSHLSLEDMDRHVFVEKFKVDDDAGDGLDWLNGIITYCKNNDLKVPQVSDEASLLLNAIKRGFPKNHYLILTAETVDKRTTLYKAIKNNGTVIDCSVSKGTRKKDREDQHHLIYAQAREILEAAGKKIAPKAFEEMYDLIGFDMHAFSRGLEKLINFVGTRGIIDVSDVRAVLTKSREEPIYELTGAISDKNGVYALRLLHELLDSGYHYLQILMAIANQVRRLLLVKDFINSDFGHRWRARMTYDQFKNVVMPMIQTYDKKLAEKIDIWAVSLGNPAGGQKQKPSTEQVIARQPNNPYPVYQQFLKADNFSENELIFVLNRLYQADVTLKTTGRKPEFVLEELILAICGSQ